MRGDRAIAADNVPLPREMVKEFIRDRDGGTIVREVPAKEPKELAGYTLTAVLRASDVAGPQKGAEINAQAIEAARRKSEPRVTIDFGVARARMVLSGAVSRKVVDESASASPRANRLNRS
jgi:hypothetical protein